MIPQITLQDSERRDSIPEEDNGALHGGQPRQMKPIYEIDKQANNNECDPSSTAIAGEDGGNKEKS